MADDVVQTQLNQNGPSESIVSTPNLWLSSLNSTTPVPARFIAPPPLPPIDSMSHQGQQTHPQRPRMPSNPPIPPTVLLRNYASTSSLATPTPRARTEIPMNPRPYSYTGNDEYPTDPAFARTRRISEPSRDHPPQSYFPPFPNATVSAARRRPQPKHLEPRPASASYAPRRPSPLSSPDPPPKPEPPHVPIPIVVAYPPAPIVDSVPNNMHSSVGSDLKTNENAMLPPPLSMSPRPKRRKLEKRRVEHSTPNPEAKATRHGSRLSFAGLSSLFSKKESCPTPNMLLLQHHYTEQYIPPTFDGVRYHKNPKI